MQMKIDKLGRNSGTRKLSICQEQYVETILERHGMSNCNPARTPMATNIQLPVLTVPVLRLQTATQLSLE